MGVPAWQITTVEEKEKFFLNGGGKAIFSLLFLIIENGYPSRKCQVAYLLL
jgi:hypothetical protein